MPGAPLLLRTATHPRHNTSSRQTLSISAWNLRPGSALAARYSPCCKARTGSRTADPETAGLAEPALTGPLLLNIAHCHLPRAWDHLGCQLMDHLAVIFRFISGWERRQGNGFPGGSGDTGERGPAGVAGRGG